MRPVKAEIEAVKAVFNEPHEDDTAAAIAVIKALDTARAQRTTFATVFRWGRDLYVGTGPFSTANQARKHIEKDPQAELATAYAVVRMTTPEGIEAAIAAADEPAGSRGDWGQVAKDAEDIRNHRKPGR